MTPAGYWDLSRCPRCLTPVPEAPDPDRVITWGESHECQPRAAAAA